MNKKEEIFFSGIDYTSEIFIRRGLIYFKRTKSIFRTEPGALVLSFSDDFFVYDIDKGTCVKLESKPFYDQLSLFYKTGISKEDETLIYNKAIDNNFVLFCLFKSHNF